MKSVLNYIIKTLACLSAITLAILFVSLTMLDADQLSDIAGFDISHCAYKGGGNIIYEFSWIDARMYILLASLLLSVIAIYVALRTDKVLSCLKSVYITIKQYSIDTFNLLKQSDVKYMLALLFGMYIYLAYTEPVTFDEAWTYQYFIKQRPVWECMFLYPLPNNHVLFSILGNITESIPGLDLLLRIRLGSILMSMLTWIIVYRFVRKFYTEKVAFLVVALGSVVMSALFYGYVARGYGMVSFFVILAMYAAFNIVIVKGADRKRDWVALALAGILGAYTMPSFLYPFVTINLFVFVYKYKLYLKQAACNIGVGVGVFLLYLPIIIVCGLESLSSNAFVVPISRMMVAKALPGFMLGTVGSLFVVYPYIVLLLIAVCILIALRKRDKDTLVMWVVFGIAPGILLLAHSVIPFFRTFSYYSFIVVFLVVITLRNYVVMLSRPVLLVLCIIIQIGGLAYYKYNADYTFVETRATELVEDGKKYYIENGKSLSILYSCFLFEAERRNVEIGITVEYGKSNADSIVGYDYFLIQKSVDKTVNKYPYKVFAGPDIIPVNVYTYE